MKKYNYLLTCLLAIATCLPASSQVREYKNPIVPGYNPDPSICRVGDTFYLVNSSFQYFPGVPIYESKDLINWRQLGNVLTRDSQLPLKGASSWLGIYAPTIRYNDGTYYMVTTNVGNGGNFFVTATNPEGPWSEPVWLSTQGIDPSLYFEDGKCYLCSNPGDAIWLCEIDPKTGEQLSESKLLWEGDGGRYPEGPHLYKKDGYYYLLISEGGTELAHHLTIARSKQIYGPYESNPANPILTNCNKLGQSKQVQGIGHGDFVQAENGSWWLVCLGYRNYGGSYHHLGRETFLAPVEWKEGEWPVVNGGMPIDTLMRAELLPEKVLTKVSSVDFKKGTLGCEFMYMQNPIPDNYVFKNGVLRLKAHGSLTENNQPTYIGRRQTAASMQVETELSLPSEKGNPRAGLSVYQINDGHIDFALTGGKLEVTCKLKSLNADCGTVDLQGYKGKVTLRIESNGTRYVCSYMLGDGNYHELASVDCSLISTEVAGGFTGVTIGMFAEGETGASADFYRYDYTEN